MWENLFLVAFQFAINVQLKYLTHKFCAYDYLTYMKKVFFLYACIKIHLSI